MILLPPRHSKSMTVSETFPSFFIGKDPGRRVIEVSYADSLAKKFGRANRRKVEEYGAKIFGILVSQDNASMTNWGIEGYPGGMISAGIGGPITGEGADCLPAGTMITTEIGLVDIVKLANMANPPLILSYDHKSGKMVFRKVIASQRKWSNEIVEVETIKGRKIRSTGGHRYYIYRSGYREAEILRPGDRLVIERNIFQKQQGVRGVRQKKEWPRFNVSKLLSKGEKSICCFGMRLLWQYVREKTLRIRESNKKRKSAILLFSELLEHGPIPKICEILLDLRSKNSQRQQNVLFAKVPRDCSKRKNQAKQNKERMPRMWTNFYSNIKSSNLLFKGMRKQCSFQKNDRKRKPQLQRWHELCKMVFGNEANNHAKRQLSVRGLRANGIVAGCNVEWAKGYTEQSVDASCRRESTKQRARKSGNYVQNMSPESPSIEIDTVSKIRRICCPSIPVYDIQVEGTSNFFANEILVHNCLIIDDPIKNRQEADSETYREMVWNEWHNTLLTRLHPGAAIIIILTRWHEDDLAGRLLAEEPEKWEVISLPAEAEENDPLGREPGEPLWPEHGYNEAWMETKKKEVGSQTWASLYQQRPSPAEGGIIKRDWWRYYRQAPARFDEIIQSWDCAFKETKDSSYVVGQVWGRKGADKYLLDQTRDRMGFSATIHAIKSLSAKWPEARAKLVEDKANGPAIIDLLKNEIPGLIPVNPEGGKVVRAQAASPDIEAGNVYIPEPAVAPWVHDFVEECAAFPNGATDDQVDAMSQALVRFSGKRTMDPASAAILRGAKVYG